MDDEPLAVPGPIKPRASGLVNSPIAADCAAKSRASVTPEHREVGSPFSPAATPQSWRGHRRSTRLICVEAFLAEATVERFHVAILDCLPGITGVKNGAVVIAVIEHSGHQLGANVDPNTRRSPVVFEKPLRRAHRQEQQAKA
jgi:hypothetical protein